jgi:hypothetical protein
MVETAFLTAEAAKLKLYAVAMHIDATGSRDPASSPRAHMGRGR